MYPPKPRGLAPVIAVLTLVGLLTIAGCNQSDTSPAASPAGAASRQTSAVLPQSAVPSPPMRIGQPQSGSPVVPQQPTSSAGVVPGAQQPATPPVAGVGAQPPAADGNESGPFAAGKQVYTSNGCARCHSITGPNAPKVASGPGGGFPGGGPGGIAGGGPGPGGPGGPGGNPGGQRPGGPGGPGGMPGAGSGAGGMMGGMGRGPELAHVGKDPTHTIEWLTAHIRNPKSHKPQSRMPAFGPEKVKDGDLKALVENLASLN